MGALTICPCGSKGCSANPARGDEVSAANRRAARRYRRQLARTRKHTERRQAIREQVLDLHCEPA